MYNLFTKHNICPDEFIIKSDMARKLLLAFSDYEIQQENKEAEKSNTRKGMR